jgi:hypothetical protein
VNANRAWLTLALVGAMLLTGGGTYLSLASHRSAVRAAPKTPVQVVLAAPALKLPGTLYMVQGGTIFSLAAGHFQQLTQPASWVQVAAIPGGGGLLAIKRTGYYSDLYQLGLDGKVAAQLTHNAAPSRFSDIGTNHWSFYPSVQPGTSTVFMSYDSGKQFDYEVDLAIWQLPLSGSKAQWRQWTFPNNYTGGDVQPLPLASGGLLYVKYDQDPAGKKGAQIWFKAQRTGSSTALTTLADDCSQPTLSPDGATLAMVCSGQQQRAQLVLADFNGSAIGPLRAVITDQVVAQPAWAPDGSGIAYLAAGHPDQPFQLWWLPRAAYLVAPSPSPLAGSPAPTPSPTATPAAVNPVQVTADLGFDATSPIAWRP